MKKQTEAQVNQLREYLANKDRHHDRPFTELAPKPTLKTWRNPK